jgi:transcriptional regulator with AAA-type ATPase domain/transcriptional regulatory protein LevR
VKRIELVLKTLKELAAVNSGGVMASAIAEKLSIERSNISRDLNTLVKEKRAIKRKSKPVLFSPIEAGSKINSLGTQLDSFARGNPSMFSIVEQGKAATLYPPKGMNMLFLGETGVGKSMMAELIYQYAVEIGRMEKDAPYVQFNCADYANNAQLLVSQIFGHKKGAYTGADSDKKGMMEQADGGVLFLDEVHRLPPEGQEMLFTYIDHGTYRRLGESEGIRSAKVLIIAATTENVDSSLLRTFTRRIPMIMHLPNLSERTLEERFYLLNLFFVNESKRLGTSIKVSVNSIRAFLSYRCENNIGQLKSDVQIVCAKAYADFLTKKKNEIVITSTDLPIPILNGLYLQVEHRKLWTSLNNIRERFFTYDSNMDLNELEYPMPGETIYQIIDKKFHIMEKSKTEMSDIEKEMRLEIDHYFTQLVKSVVDKDKHLEAIVPDEILSLVKELVLLSEKKLNKKLTETMYYAFAIHITNTIKRVKARGPIENPKLTQIKEEYPKEFEVGKLCVERLNIVFDTNIPEDEAGFITLFFVNDYKEKRNVIEKTRIIVIGHGKNIATALVDTVHQLLGCTYAIAINASLEERPQEVLERLKILLSHEKNKQDILFLVDMGSLTTFAEEISKELDIQTRVIPLVSTLHVLEATRKAMLGYSLDEIYQEVSSVYQYLGFKEDIIHEKLPQKRLKHKAVILTVCLTGEGTARTIQKVIENQVIFDREKVSVMPINLVGKESIASRIRTLEQEYKIICVISAFGLDTDVPQFNLYNVLNLSAIEGIQTLVTDYLTYFDLAKILKAHVELAGIDMEVLVETILSFNTEMEKLLNVHYDINVLLGFSLHLCGLVERIIKNEPRLPFVDEDNEMKNNTVVVKRTQMLFEKYFSCYINKVQIDDLYYISKMYLKQMQAKRPESN